MAQRVRFTVVFATLVLLGLLIALAALSLYYFEQSAPGVPAPEQAAGAGQQFLPVDEPPHARFRPEDIPPWLFGHVGIIAALQVAAVLAAGAKASKHTLRAHDRAVVGFLIEVPMYLGLFGTLLGVCLTQFISGTLVAPLAYITTMSGIVLHIFGKLTIALPIAADGEDEG